MTQQCPDCDVHSLEIDVIFISFYFLLVMANGISINYSYSVFSKL